MHYRIAVSFTVDRNHLARRTAGSGPAGLCRCFHAKQRLAGCSAGRRITAANPPGAEHRRGSRGVHLLAVVLLWWLGILGLYVIFAVIALEYFLAAVVAHKRFPYATAEEAGSTGGKPEPMFRQYLRYCSPLIPLALIGFAYEFADRWLLQNYGGSIEQAYYAVGAQFAGIALIATSSMLRIFWKEVAEANSNGDHARLGMLYQKVSRLLFLVGAMIAGFLMPWSEDLLRLILGASYVGGAATLTIMFLFPIHQSMGQIGGTLLYATERVTLRLVFGHHFHGCQYRGDLSGARTWRCGRAGSGAGLRRACP